MNLKFSFFYHFCKSDAQIPTKKMYKFLNTLLDTLCDRWTGGWITETVIRPLQISIYLYSSLEVCS